MHRGHWFSAHDEAFVPILAAVLKRKHVQVHEGQAHRCHRRDPTDTPS